MDLNKEYKGSSLKIEISDLKLTEIVNTEEQTISTTLKFKCGAVSFDVFNFGTNPQPNWAHYVAEVTDEYGKTHTYVVLPASDTHFPTGILTLVIEQTTHVGNLPNYKSVSQPIPLVELVEQEAFLDTCDNCFSVYEHEGKVLVKCNMNCETGKILVYKDKSCEGLENEPLKDANGDIMEFEFNYGICCITEPELEDGVYKIAYKADNNSDDYPVGDLYIYNNMIKDVVEDLKTILCNCGCPSCLECGEVDEDYMKHLLSNLNTLLIAYNDRLREPIKMIKEALKCIVLPSDLERKCIQISNDTKGDNPENNQFKKLGAFYYLVLAQDAINNLKNIYNVCEKCIDTNPKDISIDDLPDYFDYTNVIQCLRALGITYQIEIPEVDWDCTVDLTVKKEWGDDFSHDSDEVNIELSKDGMLFKSFTLPINVGENGEEVLVWEVTEKGLNKYQNGKLIEYIWDEPTVPSGYTKSIKINGNVTTITNTQGEK